jgi:hypothetical protein
MARVITLRSRYRDVLVADAKTTDAFVDQQA